MTDGEYSFSLTTFSPNGKLVQIEHALNAVSNLGRPALGIKAKNGVVLATEKKPLNNFLIEDSSLRKIEIITDNIGCVYSGMPADFRIILAKARKEAQVYWCRYGDTIPVLQLVQRVAAAVQEYTHSGGVRPLGVSLLIGGYGETGPELYQVDPSGTYLAWKATALGKDSLDAKTFLEKRHNDELELEDAVHTAILTLKEGFEGAMNENNVQIGMVGSDMVFKVLTPAEVKDYLQETE